MLKIRINQIKALLLVNLFSLITIFMKKKVWVISERGTDARDNGYYFYRYLKKNHPEIKVYYIIDKKSSDYEKVKEDAVQYGSLKNYWVVTIAQKLISSHYALILPSLFGKVWKLLPLRKKFYFLQHGVIYNDLVSLHREKAPMKLFICGAKPEYEYIKKKLGHEEVVDQYTGLARYDNLHNIQTKKQILIMPTWRGFIRSKEGFLKSKYYQQFQSLLKNKELNSILETNGYELIFYPHYEFQKYLDCFNVSENCIKLASFQEYDVQTLLKESKLLITDFSSVFFDFAYMKKPVIFFHFDANEFFERHYEKGYFNYEQDGFGCVCLTTEDVIEALKKHLLNDCLLEDIYKQRIEAFFSLHDENNCQRIYEKIIEK